MELNHTIVRTHDKVASAEFFARIFGLEVIPAPNSLFVGVPINPQLTIFFATSKQVPEAHYAFKVSETEFDAIWGRVKAAGITWGSGPFRQNVRDGQIAERRGGRGLYFEDPNGHVLEMLTTD